MLSQNFVLPCNDEKKVKKVIKLKKIILALLVIITAFCAAGATELVKISKITGTVNIKTPDGDSVNYKNISDIPEFLYGSKVTAVKGAATVSLLKTVTVALGNRQGIFITKNPITKAIELFRLDIKGGYGDIKADLAGLATVTFGPNTKIAFSEEFPGTIVGVISGTAVVRSGVGRIYMLSAGEHYEVKQNLLE